MVFLQRILHDHQAPLRSSLRPLYLQRGGFGPTWQDPERSEPDAWRPEDPAECLGEDRIVLDLGRDFLLDDKTDKSNSMQPMFTSLN